MKTSEIIVHTNQPPTVELDSAAHAAYVRFSRNKVNRTQAIMTDGAIVTADLDRAGRIVGIELIGVKQFGIRELIAMAGVRGLPKRLQDQARYVPARLQAA